MTSTSVEQLEKLVGQEYAVEPVSTFCPQSAVDLNPATKVSWNKRDLLTYAVGIGANATEKQFVYGLPCAPYSSQPKPDLSPSLQNSVHLDVHSCPLCLAPSLFLPARPFVCCLPHVPSRLLPQRYCSHVSIVSVPLTSVTGADQDVVDFADRVGGSNTIEGLPTFDPRRVVHASQTIEVLKPLPLVSGPGWKLKKRLASIRENSSCRPTHSTSRHVHRT
jgi:hypothetical protein